MFPMLWSWVRRLAVCLLWAGTGGVALAQSPAVVVASLKSPTALFIDADFLYFGELDGTLGTLNRVLKTGGPKSTLASGTSVLDTAWAGILRIDFSPTHIYAAYGGYT